LKTITDEQARLINDARAEGIVALSAAILEKDILVTEALRVISTKLGTGVTLTFTGGTCLSKAHGLLQRMSEDVDFRVVPDGMSALARNAKKNRLRDVHNGLLESLRTAGFEVGPEDITIRNEYHKFSYALHYQSAYDADASLRPSVLVEFTAIPPRLPTTNHELRPLIDTLTGRATAATVTFGCIAVEETYCEKIVSYLRRSAEHIAQREHSQYEERLARHIYDVHCIESEYFGRHQKPRPSSEYIRELVAAEAQQFGNRLTGFARDPVGVMRATLRAVGERPEFKEHYTRFAQDLIYAETPPTFEVAFLTFQQSAERFFAPWPRT
jgi:predicted nucleotidyltransferase component of viral defense system